VDPNTTPSPHPHHHHTSDSENTQVIRVRKQGETTKKMEKTKSLTQINFWTNQPMEKSPEMTTKSSSRLPGTNANFQILANQ
jgi:hypothetical protein